MANKPSSGQAEKCCERRKNFYWHFTACKIIDTFFRGTKLGTKLYRVFDLCSDVLNSEECQTKSFSFSKCLLFSKPFIIDTRLGKKLDA